MRNSMSRASERREMTDGDGGARVGDAAALDGHRMKRSVVLAELFKSTAPITRPELAHRTGLSSATIWRLVDDLISRGLVVEAQFRPSGQPGRQAITLEVAAAP